MVTHLLKKVPSLCVLKLKSNLVIFIRNKGINKFSEFVILRGECTILNHVTAASFDIPPYSLIIVFTTHLTLYNQCT
jgi:hypothetical protein